MASDSPNTPLALALIGGATLAAFMAVRPWPQAKGKSVRPEAYAQSIITGSPMPAGPEPADNTSGIEAGLSAILGVWVISKLASMFGSFPQFFGGGGTPGEGNSGGEGGGGEGGGGEEGPPPVEDVPPPLEV